MKLCLPAVRWIVDIIEKQERVVIDAGLSIDHADLALRVSRVVGFF